MYLFMRNVRILKQLRVTLKSDYFRIRTKRQRELIHPTLSIWKMTYVTFWILVSTTIVSWAILPLFNKGKDLPFKASYPYDTKASPVYEITYIHQVVGIFLSAMASLNIDTFMAALMMIIGAQCDLLCDDLRNLKNSVVSDFVASLIECIKRHKEILSFAEESNKFFSMIVLGQFFTSTVTLGLTMFQLSLVDPLSTEGYPLLFYESSLTVQLFLYCWFGNEVEI
ncbi:7tm 6 domain containing protein, partial [Asbolus verrucosus]